MSWTERLEKGTSAYLTGMSSVKAAQLVGLTQMQLYRHLRTRNLIRKTRPDAAIRGRDPDEQTIARRAAEIQAEWSPEEHAKRWVGRSGIRVVSRTVRWQGVA